MPGENSQFIEQESIIEPETSSCEEDELTQEYCSCLSTTPDNSDIGYENEPSEVMDEKLENSSYRFVTFNICFGIAMVILFLMILQSPMVSKEDCSEDLKGCLLSLWKDFRRYFDFYF